MSARADQQAVVVEPRGFDAPRSYLFVSAREPLAAAVALWSWADGPPDLCITSPSPEAQDTAAFAAAGRFVTIFDEPLLARRRPDESWDNFRDRFAQALRIVATYDTRAALVVCDELPDALGDAVRPRRRRDHRARGRPRKRGAAAVSTGTILIVAGAFLACAVEMVEALTIVLSVGVAAGVAVALAPTALLTHEGVNAWCVLPPAAVVLALSLRRASDRG